MTMPSPWIGLGIAVGVVAGGFLLVLSQTVWKEDPLEDHVPDKPVIKKIRTNPDPAEPYEPNVNYNPHYPPGEPPEDPDIDPPNPDDFPPPRVIPNGPMDIEDFPLPPPLPHPDDVPDIVSDDDPYGTKGRDPMMAGEEWRHIPLENNRHCETKAGVYRADWDNDGFYECGTYTMEGRILINNPVPYERMSITQFEGSEFTHIWQDTNRNMIIDKGDILERKQVRLIHTENHYEGKRHENGNLVYEKLYSKDLDEHVYSTKMRFWMKGTR